MNILSALAGVVIKELYRRKDFYVLFVLTALITLVLGSVTFFDDKRIIRYLKEICQTLIWISSLVIAILTAGRQIPAEKESRTLFPLLAKPVSRAQLIFGKFLGCWLACGIALGVFYLFFGVLVGTQEAGFSVVNCIKAFWLHWACLAIITSMALFGSLLFASIAANATILFLIVTGILLAGGHLNTAASNMTEPLRTLISVIYYAIPHLEWYDIRDIVTHNSVAVGILPILGATVYAALYSLLLLGAAVRIFKRKSLA
jgi:ABC-type transport system involved in multi-copper enzyme maturation permease subunit